MNFKLILLLHLAFGLVATLQADTVLTPVAANSASGSLSSRPIQDAIDSSGLSGGGTSGDILGETHSINDSSNTDYFIARLSGAALTFALPEASSVNVVHLWTYSRPGENDRGMAGFDISFSTDGGATYGTPININGIAPGDHNDPPTSVQSLSFVPQEGVTHIRINNIVTHGDSSYYGLSEIRFGSSESIPAPKGMIIMISGMGSWFVRDSI